MEDCMKIVSHFGIFGEILPDRRFSVISPYWDEMFPSYAYFSKKYDISPVCVIESHEIYGRDVFLFSNFDDSGVISSTLNKEIELRELAFNFFKVTKNRAAFRVLFYFGALRHNLCSIVKAYIETARHFQETLTIPGLQQPREKDSLLATIKLPISWICGLPVSRVDICTLGEGYVEDIFYEMMAYLVSARSILDSLLPILKTRPSIKQSGSPPSERSYNRFMNRITKYKIPISLKEFLVKNGDWTSKLIEYRNCLLHHEILSRSYLPSAMVIHSENRIVALFIWLPDNPEVYSIKKFSFDAHVDYLGYAHETYLKLLDLCFNVLKDTYSEVKDT